jgi:predicted transglutaminase-like cysteine proteinase
MRLGVLFSAILFCCPALAADDYVGFWPIGFEAFCKEHPDQCRPRKVADPANFLQWESTLEDLNREVNASIKFRNEEEDHFDDWPEYGDCDDYATTKRNLLIKRGFDPSNLLYIYAYLTELHELHTTLVVRTNYGLKVMDNISDEPYDLDRLKADWIWMQTPRDPKIWLPVN